MILDNEHRSQDDKEYGKLLKTMWDNDLPRRLCVLLNTTRLVGKKLKLPKEFPKDHDVSYAAPYNKDRNAISAGNFQNHIIATHPPFKHNEPDGGEGTRHNGSRQDSSRTQTDAAVKRSRRQAGGE